MYSEVMNLWENTPGMCEEIPTITYYKPDVKKSDAAVVILPGGGYSQRAPHEGEGYATFLAENGISAFVVAYRVVPHRFPLPLLDARRGIRYVRYFAEKFGIDKNKIALMGSSAGGHLTAFTSTYTEAIDFEGIDEIDREDFLPNAQILCYPVVNLYNRDIAHIGSGNNLIGNNYSETNDEETRRKFSPNLLVKETTPQAFIWHTCGDASVDIENSLEYATELHRKGVNAEVHLFPDGRHGYGLTPKETKMELHISQWSDLLIKWFDYIEWFNITE